MQVLEELYEVIVLCDAYAATRLDGKLTELIQNLIRGIIEYDDMASSSQVTINVTQSRPQ